jgi:hypothetical protein
MDALRRSKNIDPEPGAVETQSLDIGASASHHPRGCYASRILLDSGHRPYSLRCIGCAETAKWLEKISRIHLELSANVWPTYGYSLRSFNLRLSFGADARTPLRQ